MKTIFTLLTVLCVLGIAAPWADAGGPVIKTTFVAAGHHPVGHPYPGSYHYGGYHGHHSGYHAYRPYPTRVYMPVPAYPVYRYPYYYYYPYNGIYYSTPGFSIGIGF
jgi:hypothetical protein